MPRDKRIDWTAHALAIASYQLKQTASALEDTVLMPRSTWTFHDDGFLVSQLGHANIESDDPEEVYSVEHLKGQRRDCPINDWTSGFFPGSLWYSYELTGDEELKNRLSDIPISCILSGRSRALMI